MKFTKPAISISDQIALLERRGMIIPDRRKAEHYLRHISYYRLRAYWLPFEQPAPINGDHDFKPGTALADVIDLYVFDRQLRLLVLDAIERIEVSFRGNWAHHLGMRYGPHGYLDPALYDRPDHYAKAYTGLMEEIERSKDTFIVHYKSKYTDPVDPPVWMTAEVVSFGQLSKWFGNLKLRADRGEIAKSYGLDPRVMVSILHHLTYVRNICAHHGRLWNKAFTVTMTVPQSPAALKLAMNPGAERLIYNTLATLAYLIGIVAPGSDWRNRLFALVNSCELADLAAMGFPNGWQTMPAWRQGV